MFILERERKLEWCPVLLGYKSRQIRPLWQRIPLILTPPAGAGYLVHLSWLLPLPVCTHIRGQHLVPPVCFKKKKIKGPCFSPCILSHNLLFFPSSFGNPFQLVDVDLVHSLAAKNLIAWIHPILSGHPPSHDHLDYLSSLSLSLFFYYKTTTNILACTHHFVSMRWSVSLRHILRSRRQGSGVYPEFYKILPLCSPKRLSQFTLPPAALITLGTVSLFNCCQSDGCEMASHSCFNLQCSPYSWSREPSLPTYIALWGSSSGIASHYPLPIFFLLSYLSFSCWFL